MRVVEISEDRVRGVYDGLATAALQWIDEPVGIFEGRPVAVAELWRAVVAAAVGEHDDSVVLVYPDGWSPHRVDLIVAAAEAAADVVDAVPRGQWDSRMPEADNRGPDTASRLRFLALALAIGLVVAGAATALRHTARIDPAGPVRTVVEGRIAVVVPADWTVTKVTAGPGSRRLQVGPSADPEVALHFTQSYAPESTLARAAKTLGDRISEQPPGLFTDFHAAGRVGGRPVVSYREIRPGRVIDWSVLLVGATLIGVGCQSPPSRTESVRRPCDDAVASARESGTGGSPAAS